jgi:hypothetical protein
VGGPNIGTRWPQTQDKVTRRSWRNLFQRSEPARSRRYPPRICSRSAVGRSLRENLLATVARLGGHGRAVSLPDDEPHDCQADSSSRRLHAPQFHEDKRRFSRSLIAAGDRRVSNCIPGNISDNMSMRSSGVLHSRSQFQPWGGSGTHAQQTARVMEAFEPVLAESASGARLWWLATWVHARMCTRRGEVKEEIGLPRSRARRGGTSQPRLAHARGGQSRAHGSFIRSTPDAVA